MAVGVTRVIACLLYTSSEDRLGEVAVFAGSEAVRGVPKLRMKGPSFVSTSADELATVIDGSYFADRKTDRNVAYGQVKYIGALWICLLYTSRCV